MLKINGPELINIESEFHEPITVT